MSETKGPRRQWQVQADTPKELEQWLDTWMKFSAMKSPRIVEKTETFAIVERIKTRRP